MKRAFIIMLLVALALWVAGCEVVDSHYVGGHHGFYGPPPAVVHHGPVYSPYGYRYDGGGHGYGHGGGYGHSRGYGHRRGHGW